MKRVISATIGIDGVSLAHHISYTNKVAHLFFETDIGRECN